MTEDIGRAAGAACAKAGSSDVVDATAVVTAAMLGAPAVVTSDPDDLNALARALGIRVHMRPV